MKVFQRNFSYLTFQKNISHQIDAKGEDDGWMSIKREHFDKIKIRGFRNLGIRALMLTKSWWERPINS